MTRLLKSPTRGFESLHESHMPRFAGDPGNAERQLALLHPLFQLHQKYLKDSTYDFLCRGPKTRGPLFYLIWFHHFHGLTDKPLLRDNDQAR